MTPNAAQSLEEDIMRGNQWFIASLLAFAGCTSGADRPREQTTGEIAASPNPYTDGPTNSPPPAASCGDMNGGGDQHVDFPTLMQQKIAEKPIAEQRQQALLAARYDLSDN